MQQYVIKSSTAFSPFFIFSVYWLTVTHKLYFGCPLRFNVHSRKKVIKYKATVLRSPFVNKTSREQLAVSYQVYTASIESLLIPSFCGSLNTINPFYSQTLYCFLIRRAFGV